MVVGMTGSTSLQSQTAAAISHLGLSVHPLKFPICRQLEMRDYCRGMVATTDQANLSMSLSCPRTGCSRGTEIYRAVPSHPLAGEHVCGSFVTLQLGDCACVPANSALLLQYYKRQTTEIMSKATGTNKKLYPWVQLSFALQIPTSAEVNMALWSCSNRDNNLVY